MRPLPSALAANLTHPLAGLLLTLWTSVDGPHPGLTESLLDGLSEKIESVITGCETIIVVSFRIDGAWTSLTLDTLYRKVETCWRATNTYDNAVPAARLNLQVAEIAQKLRAILATLPS